MPESILDKFRRLQAETPKPRVYKNDIYATHGVLMTSDLEALELFIAWAESRKTYQLHDVVLDRDTRLGLLEVTYTARWSKPWGIIDACAAARYARGTEEYHALTREMKFEIISREKVV